MVKQFKEQYLVDETGKRIGVLLDIDQYHKMLEELEELEVIRAYDAAKAADDESVPLKKALDEIEKNRNVYRQ